MELNSVSSDVLQKWLQRPHYYGSQFSYEYDTLRDRNECLVFSAFAMSFYKHVAELVWRDSDPRSTAYRVHAAVSAIRDRASESVRFRILFKELKDFIDDLLATPTSAIPGFMKHCALQILEEHPAVAVKCAHGRFRHKTVPQKLYETTLATCALFYAEGAGLETYYMQGVWKQPDRTLNAALTVLLYFTLFKCAPAPSSDFVPTEYRGTEQILLLRPDYTFQRFFSHSATRDATLYKDMMMWDITLNCCNEYAESAWSISSLERVMWAMEYGRTHMERDVYDKLRALGVQRNIDFTQFSPLLLMSFSISGLVRFSGLYDCAYAMTSSPEAAVQLHGHLPMPTIEDLVHLKVLKSKRRGEYYVQNLPGSDKKFKAVNIENRIKFVESSASKPFKAELCQQVG